MSADQESASKVLSVLSHPLRREILLDLSDNGESSFTDLLNLLRVDTGKLSFHLRALAPYIEQTQSSKYRLNRSGETAVRVIRDVEGWAKAADMQGKTSQLPLASIQNRVVAFIIDFAIIFALIMTISYIPNLFSLSTIWVGINPTEALFVTIGLLWLYSTLLEGFNGQSLGKRFSRLKVVRVDGKKMSCDHAAVRNFGKVLPLLPFDLFVGWRLKNPAFLRYFDKFAETTVIDLRIPT